MGRNSNNRILKDINIAYFVLPLILLPLVAEFYFHEYANAFFTMHKESILFANILYIVVARLTLLDSALYIFTHNKHTINGTLMRIVMLYLEITVITILYYAIVFYIFDVFSLFHLSASLEPQNLQAVKEHDFITSIYISAVTFTTLGSGDWLPQTLYAMIAVTSEVILGVIQGGVFVAIIIYGHQNRNL